MTMIFNNLKVVELASVLAGPSVGMFFAELGAQVIKVEHPEHPDVTRSWKIASENKEESASAYFSSINYKKEYIHLNLNKENDHFQLIELLKDTDILLTNFKKGDVEKFNLTDDLLLEVNPRLIHGKISGFGSDSDRVAYDLILQAETGFMSMNGTEDSGPVKMPVALIDVLAAHQLKEGMLCALLERHQTGKGKTVEVSLYDAAVCSLVNQASVFLMEQKIPQRIGSKHPNIAPYGELFTTKDAAIITFAIGSDQQFGKLLSYLELDEIAKDERFSGNQNRIKNRAVLTSFLEKKIKNLNSSEILRWALEQHVPCGKVKSLDEVFSEPQAKRLVREENISGKVTKRVTGIAFNL